MNTGGYISARADKGFSFRSSQPIYVALPDPQSAKERGFRQLLVTELKNIGLAVNHHLTSDTLLLFFKINDESTNVILIPGNPAISRLPTQWIEINLELYSLKDVKDSGPIWEGYMKVQAKKYNVQPGDSIRPLLEIVGRNFEGPLPIRVYTKTEPGMSPDELERLEKKVKSLEERIEELQGPTQSQTPSEKESTPTKEFR